MLDVLDLASRHGVVVLTGDGGDLLLLPTSLLDQMRHVPLMSLANDVIASLRLGLRPPLGLANRVRQWRTSEGIPGWLSDDLLDRFDPHARWREVRDAKGSMSAARGRAFDVTDPWWTSMFEGLDPSATSRPVEVRYPFFDVRLAEFALRLPSFPWCLDKRVLREATRGKLPHAIRTRPKTPLAESPVSRTGQWSSQRAVELFERTPAIASFVDARKFSSSVRGDSLLSNESLSAWAAISLARWLNEGQRSKAKVKGASLHRLRVGDSF
jgi:asparagine synthase (glutamine-hydrolysing)